MIKVLVVDDSVTIRAMLTQVLGGDRELRATAVASVDEAEALLATERFDVVTLDVVMPGRGGMELLGTLVEVHRLPVIMLSSATAPGSRTRIDALLAGAAACFDKADVVRQAPALIRLVKDVARGRNRIGPEDRAAMADAAAG